MTRGLIASILFLATLGLFAIFGIVAWQALTSLPARDEIAQASSNAQAVAERARTSVRERRTAAATVPAATTEGAPGDDVRYLNQDGIVSLQPDGPLTRAESTVVIPPPPGPEPTLYRLVVIESAGTINARSHMMRLAYVDAPGAEEICTTSAGREWPCGRRARTALRRLVRRRAVECLDLEKAPVNADGTPAARGSTPRLATCTVADTDLSRWLLEQGWATPATNAPEAFANLAADAKAAGRGLYDPDAR
ncbi:hypothetical protein [Acuticoccus kandeliae]|uniref:hypothetical protein n=1 Tax=Acuticoccus kandeliae TaxID=2073160 RepID=UPI000D3E548C|nr:hypothetical protein [Acuticoccus kandeliae]